MSNRLFILLCHVEILFVKGVLFIVSLNMVAITACPGGCRLSIRQICRGQGHHKRDICVVIMKLTVQADTASFATK